VRYAVLLAYEPSLWRDATDDERAAYHQAHLAFHDAVGARARLVAGEALADADMATTLRRVAGRPVLTDGPLAESAEQVGGLYLVDAPDLDVMTSLCELLPQRYSIEIRPVVAVDGFGER
jgi:hypothetical protein